MALLLSVNLRLPFSNLSACAQHVFVHSNKLDPRTLTPYSSSISPSIPTTYLLLPMSGQDNPLYSHLSALLSRRAHPKTICPSEAARALSGTELHAAGVAHWRDLMPTVRTRLFAMRAAGEVEILQGGEVLGDEIDEGNVRGPIRARLKMKE